MKAKLNSFWRIPSTEKGLYVLVIVFTLAWTTFASLRHARFNSTAYDLAIYDQVMWNTVNGRFFATTIELTNSYLADHVQPILILLAPFYALWPGVHVLFLTQALACSLAAIPVYHIARHKLAHPGLALLFASVYLLYPTLSFVNRFDFHPIAFAPLFLLLAVQSVGNGRFRLATLWVFLAVISNDEIGLTVFVFGLYVAFKYKQKWLGGSWAVGGLVWSLLVILVIIPAFRQGASDTLTRYGWLGEQPATQLQTLLTQPGLVWTHLTGDPLRQAFLGRLLLPVGFLALFSPLTLVIGLPTLAYNLLSDIPSQHSIYFHYMIPFVPIAVLAAIEGVNQLQRRLPIDKRLLAVWLMAGTAVSWMLDNPFTYPIEEPYFPVYTLQPLVDVPASRAALAYIPPHVSVATTMTYAPHVSGRPVVHLFYDRLRLQEWAYGFPQTDYLLLNLSDMRYWVNPRLYYAQIETAIGRFGYQALYFEQDVVVLAKTAESSPITGAVLRRVIELQEAGGKFAPTAPQTLEWMGQQWVAPVLPVTAFAMDAAFENQIALLGYGLSTTQPTPGGALCAVLYWKTAVSIPTDYTIFFHLVDPTGYVHTQRDSTPAQGFYPTTTWQPNQLIGDMHCLQIPPQLPPHTYGINVGLYDPTTGQRLEIQNKPNLPAPGAIRLQDFVIP